MKPTRRQFLTRSAAAAAAPYFVSAATLGAADAPSANNRLNIACIGMGGQMQGLVRHAGLVLKHNIAAICDVDQRRFGESRKNLGPSAENVKTYKDYRKLLEAEKAVDAVIIATPDHWHYGIIKAALQAGKHIYCEKPLAHSVQEARDIRRLWRASKVVTQTGNQGSASGAIRRSIELIQGGLLGDVREVHVWHPKHAKPYGMDRPEGADPVPAGLDWDFWVGPSAVRPYKEGLYHPFVWRAWYDFGSGTLGDFCCHGFNLPVRALKLNYPTRIEIAGEPLGKETYPLTCRVTYHFPQRDNLPQCRLIWYAGGEHPPAHATAGMAETFNKVPDLGCLVVGDKGTLSAGLWNSECYLRLKDEAKFKGGDNHEAAKAIERTLPRSPGHMEEWVRAIQGGPIVKVFSDFDLGGHMTEIGLAGVVALRLGKEIAWNGEAMNAPGTPEADDIVRPKYRKMYEP